jgi:hypothetical protein
MDMGTVASVVGTEMPRRMRGGLLPVVCRNACAARCPVARRPLHVVRLHVGCCTVLRSAAAWRRYPLHPSHTRLRNAVEEADDARAAARHTELLVRRVDDRRAPAPCVRVCVCMHATAAQARWVRVHSRAILSKWQRSVRIKGIMPYGCRAKWEQA